MDANEKFVEQKVELAKELLEQALKIKHDDTILSALIYLNAIKDKSIIIEPLKNSKKGK